MHSLELLMLMLNVLTWTMMIVILCHLSMTRFLWQSGWSHFLSLERLFSALVSPWQRSTLFCRSVVLLCMYLDTSSSNEKDSFFQQQFCRTKWDAQAARQQTGREILRRLLFCSLLTVVFVIIFSRITICSLLPFSFSSTSYLVWLAETLSALLSAVCCSLLSSVVVAVFCRADINGHLHARRCEMAIMVVSVCW